MCEQESNNNKNGRESVYGKSHSVDSPSGTYPDLLSH